MGLDATQSAYVFLVNHAKAVLSAAVRASVMGPYQAQAVLGSGRLQSLVTESIQREWNTEPEDAGQSVPVLDLWVGRHELLYSRIFNS
jgi:urease accessory protein